MLGIHTFLFRVLWLWNAESPPYLDLKSSLLEVAFYINPSMEITITIIVVISVIVSKFIGYYDAVGGVAGPWFLF